ncbi:MAG TPA: hypothetical protein PKD05_14040, partial [Candidatus Melainabacteria bacterium]|nr:hypothetical protein [Candidatus Melainabacteria bacterium]
GGLMASLFSLNIGLPPLLVHGTPELQAEVIPSRSRARMPQLTESSVLSPIAALDTYLDEVAPENKERLLERAREVISKVSAELHSGESVDN